MRRPFPVIAIFLAVLLVSCDLMMALQDDGSGYDVYLVSVALNYHGIAEDGISELEGTLNDQRYISQQLEHLCSLSGVGYDAWLVSDGSLTSEGLNGDEDVRRLMRISGGTRTERELAGIGRDTIDDILCDVSRLVDGDDLLVFHYSGHGYAGTGDILLPGDGYGVAYPLDDLAAVIERVPCNRFIFMDSCYSGNIVDVTLDDVRTGLDNLFTRYDLPDSRTWYSASCQVDEESFTDMTGYPVPLGAHSAGLLKALGFDIMALEPGRPEDDVLTINTVLERTTTGYDDRQHSTSTSGTRDLVLFRFD